MNDESMSADTDRFPFQAIASQMINEEKFLCN